MLVHRLTCSPDRLHISHLWKNRSNGSGCVPCPRGEPKAFCIYRLSPTPPSPQLPSCPCRPCARVTYNWFINNVNRCFWSSLASCQLAGKLFHCCRLPDCILFSGQWHRMKVVDVVLIQSGGEETSISQQLVKTRNCVSIFSFPLGRCCAEDKVLSWGRSGR